MKQVRDLVQGRIDFHIHPGPDPFARVLDSYENAWLAARYDMKALVFKTSHYHGGSTAQMIDSLFPNIKIIGGLCIENAVGGFNPRAAEIALQCGAKVVWMPFLDAKYNIETFEKVRNSKTSGEFSMMRDLATNRSDRTGKKLNVSEDGTLLPEVHEILRIIASHDSAVSSGHMSAPDRKLLVKAAKEAGVKKIILTHVNALQAFAEFDELEYWKNESDVFAEFVYNPIVPYFGNQNPELVAKMIRTIGPDRCVLGTDLGISQAFKGYAWPSPLEGMAAFIGLLEQQGFSDKEIDVMSIDNPSWLLDI